MRSLRARLFVGLSALVVATNIGFGLLAYLRAVEEASELQDAVLRQVGQFALRTKTSGLDLASGEEESEFRVVIEESGEPRPGGVLGGGPDGISTIERSGTAWRLLVLTRPDGSRVGIRQSTQSRDERVRDAVLQTLVPVLMLIPCLLLLVGAVIQASFRPVQALSARIDARAPDDLRTLPGEAMPNELRPFIAAIDRLLARVGEMVEQRRRFVADAAHELRTPVTALTVQAENLARLDLPAEGRMRLAALQGGISRLGRLLEQLLSLALYENGPTTTGVATSLDLVARGVIAEFMPAALERSMDLGFGRIEPVRVAGDPTSLHAMIRNLVDNAIRHSPEGGRIDVDVFRDGTDAVLLVTDSGRGIPADELDRIVDPFVRGRHVESGGTGLGLSIVASIARSAGGRFTFANRGDPPAGLVATVRLPAMGPGEAPTADT